MQKEINKYLKLINSEKLKKNYHSCIELYNVVGGLHTEIGSYEEAFFYHEEAHKLCRTVGDRSLTTVTFRYMGEAKAALGSFYQAIDYIKRYLELAEKLNNKVEVQRAWTTLGRVYLMQAQDLKDKNTIVDNHTKEIAREAEKRFQTALTLAESVRDQVDEKEYAQMISGLLMNLGLVKDICGQHQEAVVKFNRAIETCRAARIKEDLYRTQITLAGIQRQRSDIKSAIKLSEEALQTAKSIGKKILICDALIELGLVRLCQRDFKNAKRTFVQAYLEKSPNEDDHSKAIRLTKLAHLIVENYERICKSETAGEQRLKSCDKLGDLFVAVGNFKLAIEFYRRAFSDAKVLQKPIVELARILYSIAETYADDGQFQRALLCYEKELSYRNGNPNEQCQSLIKVAHMSEYLEMSAEKVAEAYEKALDKAGKEPKLMHQVLKYYVPYMKQKAFNPTRCRKLEETLLNLKSYPEVVNEIETEDQEDAVDDLEDEVTNIDDVITDDEDGDEVLMLGRRRAGGAQSKFKQNEVGDTPLHEASIKGDLKRVKSLIAQGHEINPRDNAGWIPLHEACNHGHYHVAEHLIEHGADVNNRGLRGVSPLHDAATNGHFDIMRLLIKSGANAIALTDSGETVLGCLRDYKNRNYSNFSNRDVSEFKQMEAELMNIMDKSGFNLMAESVANLGNSSLARNKTPSLTSESQASHHKTHQSRLPITSSSKTCAVEVVPINNSARFKLDTVDMHDRSGSSSIKDYRNAIQTLKRKRGHQDVSEPVPKKSQPAVLVGGSGSISTKQWLAADDFEEYEDDGGDDNDDDDRDKNLDLNTNSDVMRKLPTSSKLVSGNSKSRKQRDKLILEDDDEEDVVVLGEKSAARSFNSRTDHNIVSIDENSFGSNNGRKSRGSGCDPWDIPTLKSPSLKRTPTPSPIGSPDIGFDASAGRLFSQNVDDFQDEQCSNWSNVENRTNFQASTTATNNTTTTGLARKSSHSHNNEQSPIAARLLQQPLSVIIDGRELLVPIKDEFTTIKELKESIVDRYCILTPVQPNIKLAPKSKPNCYLFNNDLCKDVIREFELIAEIESWNLDTIENTYLSECLKFQLSPLNHIKIELRSLDEDIARGSTRAKIDWSHVRLPRSHLQPILIALSRRSFQCANFQGSTQLFEYPTIVQDLLLESCILSWQNLTRLSLKGTGLLRSQFELLCSGGGSSHVVVVDSAANHNIAGQATIDSPPPPPLSSFKAKLPELWLLDVSVNSIAYKFEEEFTTQLKRLRQVVCPKLKRLDVRRNHLQFVKKNAAVNASTVASTGTASVVDGNNQAASGAAMLSTMPDIEVLVGDQYDYSLYTTATS